jgi:hypothetical protein
LSESNEFATAEEAAFHFVAVFQNTAACVCNARFNYPAAQPLDTTRSLVFAGAADVSIGSGLYLYAAHYYTVVQTESSGYVVRTGGYVYSVNSDERGGELFGWHWHPESSGWCAWPHIHAPAEHGDHLPTGRVAFEQIVRWLIEEASMSPLRPDWAELLDENEADWRSRRTWA